MDNLKEMKEVIKKVKATCEKAENVSEERRLRQLLKQICSYTARYVI